MRDLASLLGAKDLALDEVTGGYDAFIRLWNPFVLKKYLWLMKGHQTSVTHILVDSRNSSILISVSKDKVCPHGPPDSFCSSGEHTGQSNGVTSLPTAPHLARGLVEGDPGGRKVRVAMGL
ncbi:hypothetical protein P7K49_009568 [Saguinus oedipus]|uniref:Uncharacterized protein n=1 Tax=Saguinus oedipus TaxID=9490 RepID=A0ABQ9VNH5_SAGOE|nr:hypothetical protein P7K49_009568 [Saguinus oedipus]